MRLRGEQLAYFAFRERLVVAVVTVSVHSVHVDMRILRTYLDDVSEV